MSQNDGTVTVYIALGGNLGDCRSAFVRARAALAAAGLRITACAPLYRGAAVGGPAGQPDYYNTVIQAATTLTATQLLRLCQKIEHQGGRQRQQRWGARTIDLDILDYAGTISAAPHLTLPHPRLHQRRFVLQPLCAIAPDWHHPRLKHNAASLLEQLPPQPALALVAQRW